MTQLPLFRERIRFDGDSGTVLFRIEGTTMAVVRFDGEWALNSYSGTEVLVDMTEVDDG